MERLFTSYTANHIDKHGGSVWHYGARYGSYYALEFLLRKLEATHPALRAEDKDGQTPVLIAIRHRRDDCAKLLLKALSYDQTIFSDGKIFLYAVRAGMFDVLEQIADSGFDPWSIKIPLTVEGRTFFGANLLNVAIMVGNTEMLEKLWATGRFEDLDSPTWIGANYLCHAARLESINSLRWLIQKGANLNAVIPSSRDTALHLSMRCGLTRNAMALLEAGASLQKNSRGEYPHDIVPQRARADLFKLWS